MTLKTSIFISLAMVMGALTILFANYCGISVYKAYATSDEDLSAVQIAISSGFIAYMACILPFKRLLYGKEIGSFYLLLIIVAILVNLSWTSIGSAISLGILWTIATLVNYIRLIEYLKILRQKNPLIKIMAKNPMRVI